MRGERQAWGELFLHHLECQGIRFHDESDGGNQLLGVEFIQRSAEANKQYSVRLKDLIRRGDTSANVEMRPGDILIIPQSFF